MTTAELPSSYHHGHLRRELLRRARATLPQTGVEGLSLRQLARDLGVSSAAPRRHFQDRAALLDAVALDGFVELDALLATIAETGDFRTDFGAVFDAYLGFAVAEPALLELMFARKYSEPAILAVVQGMARRTSNLMEGAQRRGEVIDGDVEAFGMAAFASVHGIAMLVGSGLLDESGMRAALRDVLTIIANGLTPHLDADRPAPAPLDREVSETAGIRDIRG